jgi:hypothetical protein
MSKRSASKNNIYVFIHDFLIAVLQDEGSNRFVLGDKVHYIYCQNVFAEDQLVKLSTSPRFFCWALSTSRLTRMTATRLKMPYFNPVISKKQP